MKRPNAALLLWFVPILAVVSQAQPSPSQPITQNIATVSFNAAVLQTAEAQKELGTLQTKFAPRQAQLQALNDEVEALRKQLSDNKLSDPERETRQQSLNQKEKQLQRQTEDFRNDSQTESQQIFQRIAQKVYAFLQTYAQQQGYSVVVERGSDTAPVVWYAANNLDITEQLIKAYNAQSGATPAKALPQAPLPH
jgi:outer membrane protein